MLLAPPSVTFSFFITIQLLPLVKVVASPAEAAPASKSLEVRLSLFLISPRLGFSTRRYGSQERSAKSGSCCQSCSGGRQPTYSFQRRWSRWRRSCRARQGALSPSLLALSLPTNAYTLLQSKNKQHRKDKPWDTDDIDHWAILPFEAEVDGKKHDPFLEESSFATLFPKYREVYLREIWGHVVSALEKQVSCRSSWEGRAKS